MRAGGDRPTPPRRPPPRRCAICGIAHGNDSGIPVRRYALTRFATGQTRTFGSIGLCDRCVRELPKSEAA